MSPNLDNLPTCLHLLAQPGLPPLFALPDEDDDFEDDDDLEDDDLDDEDEDEDFDDEDDDADEDDED